MKPTAIPSAEVWAGAERVVISPPNGDLTDDAIRAVDALVDVVEVRGHGHARRFAMRIALEPGDLERLAAGEPFWLSIMAMQLPPFDIGFAQEDGA